MKTASTNDQENVLAFCFVALAAFSENSLTPTQRQWARERAENCLWALGVPEHKGFRETFTARELEVAGAVVDLQATRLLAEVSK